MLAANAGKDAPDTDLCATNLLSTAHVIGANTASMRTSLRDHELPPRMTGMSMFGQSMRKLAKYSDWTQSAHS